jgi:hypothetical protein
MVYRLTCIAGLSFLVMGLACDFSPTAPFAGFDDKGSRVSGIFESEASALTQSVAQGTFDAMVVFVKQKSDLTDSVESNGSFNIAGIPQGTLTLSSRKATPSWERSRSTTTKAGTPENWGPAPAVPASGARTRTGRTPTSAGSGSRSSPKTLLIY